MDKLLQDILDIKRGNRFLEYIIERIQRTDYRGIHVSQHNRYDLDKLVKILQAIHKFAEQDKFSVPKGDTKKDANRLKNIKANHPIFHDIYERLRSQGIVKAPDPLRKNFFVDFSRMGFIEKYDKNDRLRNPFKRTYTAFLKLSADGLKLIESKSLFEKHKIFTDGVERLLKNTLTDLVAAIDLSDYRRERFFFEEYTLIFSDGKLSGAEKIAMLDEWRSLKRTKREKAVSFIQKYCDPKKFVGDKTRKRDYHNWRNETQQLMRLFKATIYFQVYENQFSLNSGEVFGVFEPKRSQMPKQEYFHKHKIKKIEYYELHHIVPLSYIKNQREYKLIDDYKNLIYLSSERHKEIKKDYIKFRHNNPKIHFVNIHKHSDVVSAKNNENARFNPSRLPEMEKYNKNLIKSLLE